MADIVDKLMDAEPCLKAGGFVCLVIDAKYNCDCAIAADEITRLRAENAKLKAAAALELGVKPNNTEEKQ